MNKALRLAIGCISKNYPTADLNKITIKPSIWLTRYTTRIVDDSFQDTQDMS